MRNKTRGVNLYDPAGLVGARNEVNSIEAELMSHMNEDRYFFTNWNQILSKYLKRLPQGFTSYYYFEFFDGKCMMRENCALDSPGREFIMSNSPIITGKAILQDLFGSSDMSSLSIGKLCLPKHPGVTIDKKN